MIDNHISYKTKFSYGIGALGKDFAVSIVYVYLMFYYTDVAGVSAAFVGTLFLLARAIDAITDPIMGMIVDNTRTRFGKFRPWIVIGTLLNAGCLLAVFSAHQFTGTSLLVFAACTYILWSITYTIMDIPYWSMIPALSSERREREKLVVWPRLFASFAWMLMGAYGLQAIGILGEDSLGDSSQADGFFNLTILITIFFIISAIVTAVNVKEKVEVKQNSNKFSLKDIVHVIGSNDQLKALIGAVLSFNIAIHLIGGFAIYYFSYAIGHEDLFPVFMLASGIAEMTGVFLFPHIANALPRKYTWLIACGFPVICCIVLALAAAFSPENLILTGLAGAALKFGFGLANGLATVMLADVVDYGEYKSGRRSESIIFSVQTMLVKFAGAFAGFFVGVGLSLVGYQPNVEQSDTTVWGIRILMIAVPVLLMLISAYVYKKWYLLHDGFDAENIELSFNPEQKVH